MFVITVLFTVQPGKADAFLPLMQKNARLSVETEPGCQRFDVCTAPQDDHTVFLYEVYDDHEAFEAHKRTAHYLDFVDKTDGLIATKTVRTYTLAT